MSKRQKLSINSDGGPIFVDKVSNKGSISGRRDVNQTGHLHELSRGLSTGEPKPTSPRIWVIGILAVALIGCLGTVLAALVGILPQLLR